MQILSSSFDSLVRNLDNDDFKYLNQEFGNNVLDLVKQKGFYSYQYMNDFEKFKEELPNKEKFWNSVTDKKIGDKEYEHALNVWTSFEMKTMKDYHDLHLKWDVFLLADVFEKFRNNSLKNDGSCPSHYFSAKGVSRDTQLKITLELISDPDKYTFFEKGIRGEISFISNRYNKTNNKYLKFYEPKQKSKDIIYFDANTLYGYAMSKFLPASGFQWTDPKRV